MGFRRLRRTDYAMDELDLMDLDARKKAFRKPKEWTIITALDRVLDLCHKSHLSDEFWEALEREAWAE